MSDPALPGSSTLVSLLLACTDTASPLLADPLAVTAPEWAALATPRPSAAGKTTVVTRGAMRFADAGPVANAPSHDEAWVGQVAVLEADVGVRVVDHAHGLRLLYWLDRDDLAPVLAESGWYVDGKRGTDTSGGVWLPAGTAPQMDETGAAVSLDWPLEGAVALPGAVIDEWYAHADVRGAPTGAALGLALVAAGVPMRSAEGAALGTFADAAAVEVLARDGDRRLVEVTTTYSCARGQVVRGWVAAADVDDDPGWLPGYGFSTCCGWSGYGFGSGTFGSTVTLPPGRLLFDAPDGEVIGVVTGTEPGAAPGEGVTLAVDTDAGELDGWTAVRAPSRVDTVTVWARDEGADLDDLVPPEGADLPEWAW